MFYYLAPAGTCSTKNMRPVQCTTTDGKITVYRSIKEASSVTGISYTGITLTCQRKRENTKGTYWEYVDADIVQEDTAETDAMLCALFDE